MHLHPADLLPAAAGIAVTGMVLTAEGIQLRLKATQPQAACPSCGTHSTRCHSRYSRTLADLPWAVRRVQITLHVRRFRCLLPTCPCTIFTERLPLLVAPYARRTARLSGVLQVLGLVVGGRPTVRLGRQLGLPISLPALLRLVRRTDPVRAPTPLRQVGIDDFARRRGRVYGTVLVDLERHRPIDLVPERTAACAAAWLAQHPTVQVVSRDRAGAYADGARQGAPQATQVADRWHLLANGRDLVERVLIRHQRALRTAGDGRIVVPVDTAPPLQPAVDPLGAPPVTGAGAPPLSRTLAQQRASWERRRERDRHIRQLAERGCSIVRIAHELQLTRPTVRRALRAGAQEQDLAPQGRPGLLTPFEPYLWVRWQQGCQNAQALHAELRRLGYAGSYAHVRAALGFWRTGPARRGRAAQAGAPPPPGLPPTVRRYSPRQAAWLLLRAADDLAPEERAFRDRLLAASTELQELQVLAVDFRALVRGRQAAALQPWLAAAQRSACPEVRAFAQGIRRDLAAVCAALSTPLSKECVSYCTSSIS